MNDKPDWLLLSVFISIGGVVLAGYIKALLDNRKR